MTTQVAKPVPANGKVKIEVDVPEGMSSEQYQKMIGTWDRNRQKGQKIGRADGKALRALIKTHKPEFTNLRRKFWKEEGLDISNLKG